MPIKRTQPLCWWCKHFDAEAHRRQHVWRCAAFAGNIPPAIINNEYDHREPHPDDNGTQFEQARAALLTSRPVFHTHTPEAITTALHDALLLLEMGRALGGVQPPLDDD
jgi:hypothetical protein